MRTNTHRTAENELRDTIFGGIVLVAGMLVFAFYAMI